MATYDPEVIQEHADRLYANAAAIVRSYIAMAGCVGLLLGAGAGSYLVAQSGPDFVRVVGALVLGAIGGGMGCALGQGKAASLRLMAQIALCQVAIEKNTRR